MREANETLVLTMVLSDSKLAADFIFSRIGKDIRLAAPLGLGKPNLLLNFIYDRVKAQPDHRLEIYTALSLDVPDPGSELEKRFLSPFLNRHFGADYIRLSYLKDLRQKTVPPNIAIHEFYFQAGQHTLDGHSQQNYISLNYTHVAQALFERGVNVVVQMVSKDRKAHKPGYSLSCNPDVTLDLADLYRKHDRPLLVIGVVHPDLPYLSGDAVVDESFFDVIVDGSSDPQHQLFALPRLPVDEADQMIGFYASQLVPDDGTLQIGIGSLSDALVANLLMRQKNNSVYRDIVERSWAVRPRPIGAHLFTEAFSAGLYGTSEMVMDGFMHLRRAGILKRLIFDLDENKRRYLHGAFFLGSKDLYQWLRDLDAEDFDGLSMTRVSKVNDLYDSHELALRRQRKRARFFNTCMNVNLLGGVASETLEDGRVVSGVGGQYNFVAMSHELPDSHSILMMRSTRTKDRKRLSNVVSAQGHLTIPRHLRDVVITEYGIACLRAKTDNEVIQNLIAITDSEFQEELVWHAKRDLKLDSSYKIPESARKNTPDSVHSFLRPYKKDGFFQSYPFGSDFDLAELKLSQALTRLKKSGTRGLLKSGLSGLSVDKKDYAEELQRMGLFSPVSPSDFFYQRLVLGALVSAK
jgi:acyl-CoA hydrolase